jgi:xylan 1,4-beta-xylosidase
MKNYLFLLFLLFVEPIYAQTNIQIDANRNIGEMKPFWAYFGYDEPNNTTKPDGQKLLSELAALSPVPVYVRAHNLLTSRGDSPGPDLKWGFTDAYSEDNNGKPIYN